MESHACDLLVVGSGAAGLRAAIAGADQGLDVLVITKGAPGLGSSTSMSVGMIAGAPGGWGPEEHRSLTLQAGRGINQEELVKVLAEEAPLRIEELRSWGLRCMLDGPYLVSLGPAPIWGKEIVRCLLARCEALAVRFASGLTVGRLQMEEGTAGVLAYSATDDRWYAFSASAVVLATGGAAALYARHDNPQRMMGEGYALALEAGAVLTDMEFVQFFPIGLAEPGLPQMLIPPVLAARGEIVNERGEDLVEKYEIRERPAVLRARDALSQTLIREMKTGQSVWLDLRRLDGDDWRDEQGSSFMRETLGERYGALHRPVRIAPMAHHTMGGIVIDAWGSSGVPGFFAAGEAAGGLHGANRMGGNALADTIVFGARAGRRAAEWAREHRSGPRKLLEDMSRFAPASEGASPAGTAVEFKKKLRKIMWEEVGVVRSGEGLRGALRELGRLEDDISGASGARDSRKVRDWIELRLGICTARVIAEASLRREESRGAHFREDFPRSDDARWLGHIEVRRDKRGNLGYSFNAL